MAVQERPTSRGAEPEQRVRREGGGRVTGEAVRALASLLGQLGASAGREAGGGRRECTVAGMHLPGSSAEDRPAAVFLSRGGTGQV